MTKIVDKLKAEIQKDVRKVYYTFPNQKAIFGKRKFEFIIRPILAVDFYTQKMAQEALKEQSSGQSEAEACRVVAQRFKDKIMSMEDDSLGKMFLEKGVVFPKIVNKSSQNCKEDEVPYSILTDDMKLFLAKKIQGISPIFAKA